MIRWPKFWLGVALAIALGVYQVHNLVGSDLARPGEQTQLTGPWVFRFRVP
jgi:hypothetical protein